MPDYKKIVCVGGSYMSDAYSRDRLHVLFVGNSFTDDTSAYLADIAASCGYGDIALTHLFIGACTVNMHIDNMLNDAHTYYMTENLGSGWRSYPDFSISEAAARHEWDYVVTMDGTGDGSMPTDPATLSTLPRFIGMLRDSIGGDARYVFNMRWTGEPTHKHPEILHYGGDVELIYRLNAENMRNVVAPMPEIDMISPVGTAIRNARSSSYEGKFTRDGYHLDRCNGRYIAALTLFCLLTGIAPEEVPFRPHGMSDLMLDIARESVRAAIACPYAMTQSAL